MKKIIDILSAAIICAALAIATASCSMYDAASPGDGSGGGDGQGGSMARFAIMGNYLYLVDHSTLKTIRLTDPAHPEHLEYKDDKPDDWGAGNIETIFPDRERNLLFIGSQSAMYIYSAKDPEMLVKLGTASHFKSCDPVVADGDWAYVTLNSENEQRCGFRGNSLNIYDISDITQPKHMKEIKMPGPRGLAIDGTRDRLMICTTGKGLILYDATDPLEPIAIDDLQNSVGSLFDEVIDTYDVIALADKGHAILTGRNGLFLLDYSNDKFALLDYIKVHGR